MRIAVLIAALAAAVGCGAGAGAPAPAAADNARLTIAYWPQGKAAGDSIRWTLRCAPAGGTLPRAAAACRRLAALRNPFAPIPKNAICTEQYGGPQVAVVSGTFRGKRLWTKLQNRNGCEIERFQRLGFLVPGYGSGAPA